jgi:CheY-like chemotaxis protein
VLRVRIIHWKISEAEPLLKKCREAGFQAACDEADFPAMVRMIRAAPPDVFVIDLSRLPSHGREVAFALRRSKSTRSIPIVFLEGEADKVEALRQQLPDAVFTSLSGLVAAVRSAAGREVTDPVIPPDVMARYATRTAAQKLGIKAGSTVALHDAPRDYPSVLGELPPDVELLEEPDDLQPVTLWFVRDPREYQAGLRRKKAIAARTKLWVVWRKGSANGLTQNLVRQAANEFGLVDYKICALDSQWSGMAFSVRKS